MPDIDSGAYLLSALQEAGMICAGLTATPLTWLEIEAYAAATGEVETHFEKRMLRRMSEAYLVGIKDEDSFSESPWV